MFGLFKNKLKKNTKFTKKKRIDFEIKPRFTVEFEFGKTKLDILQEAISEEKKKRIPKARKIKIT